MLELCTGVQPFANLKESQLLQVINNMDSPLDYALTHYRHQCSIIIHNTYLTDVLTQCFRPKANERPSAETILRHPFFTVPPILYRQKRCNSQMERHINFF